MKQHIVGRVAFSLLAASVLCLIPAGVASASGGSSADAKFCQKGGWESLVTPPGQTFASQGSCVSYATMGGAALGVSASVANGSVTYAVSGFGLMPNALWSLTVNSPSTPSESLSLSVGASGTISGFSLAELCGAGSSAFASVKVPAIITPTVNSPCG